MTSETTTVRPTRLGVAAAAGIVVAALLTAACTGGERPTAATVAPTVPGASVPATPTAPTPAGAAPTTSAATDEALSGPAGRVTALSSAPERPDPTPPQGAPVLLTSVDPGADPAPGPVPVALHVVGAGDLVSNAPGCASQCVTSAVLTPSALQPDLRLSITTSTKVSIRVYRSTNAPQVSGGVPYLPGAHVPARSQLTKVTEWSTVLDRLAAGTRYHVLVKVTDRFGNSQYLTGSARTAATAQDLTAGTGCAVQCITSGIVTPTHEWNTYRLVVATDTPAELDVAVSPQEPGWVAGRPLLPADVPVTVPSGLRTSWELLAPGLSADTTYHVVVRATDAEGRTAFRVGEFVTGPEPATEVVVTFERFFVIGDGDAADWNLGEISFAWGSVEPGAFPEAWGARSYDKIDAGDDIGIAQYNSRTYVVEPGGSLPSLIGSAMESDRRNQDHPCDTWASVDLLPTDDFNCTTTTTPAVLQTPSLDWVRDHLTCANYGFSGAKADDICLLVYADHPGDDDWVDFAVLVSFHFDR